MPHPSGTAKGGRGDSAETEAGEEAKTAAEAAGSILDRRGTEAAAPAHKRCPMATEGKFLVFNRFGQIDFDPVPLERFGLMRKWKKLGKLQAETADLISSYEQAAARVAELEAGRAEARDKDLDAHAHALRSGAEIPEPTHEPTLDRELAGASRTRDALARAVEGAMADVTSYRLEHAAALQRDVQAALDERAQELAQHARAASALYAELQNAQLVARRMVPRQAAPENTGEPQDSAVLIGPLTRQTVSGPNPGEIEAVLNYLTSLGPPTEVGPAEGESAA